MSFLDFVTIRREAFDGGTHGATTRRGAPGGGAEGPTQQNKTSLLPHEKLLLELFNNKNEWEHIVKFLQPFQIGKKFSMFIAGGFAAFICGRTTEFNDIDIFLYAKSDEIEQSVEFTNIIQSSCSNDEWAVNPSPVLEYFVFTSKKLVFKLL